jgi:fumarate reductase flavoprotein subunit
MAASEKGQETTSRRRFIKRTAVAGAGVAATAALGGGYLPGSAAAPASVTSGRLPKEWDEEADVVIIGSGGTGLAAAIEARDAGGSVIVLEKMKELGGTTKLSGGVIQASGTDLQKAEGIANDTPDAHYEYWMAASEGIADPALVKVMAGNSAGNIEWLESQGLRYTSLSAVSAIPGITEPGLMVPRIHYLEGDQPGTRGRGERMARVLFDQAQRKGVRFLFETPATALIYDPTDGVIGVRATRAGEEISVRARKAVILAAGSFDHNKDMARAFSLQQLWALETGVCLCNPGNVGDGIKMAMALGADLASMGGTGGFCSPSIGYADSLPGIWVNKAGLRFTNENGHYSYIMRAVFNQPAHTAWAIFDETTKNVGGQAVGVGIASGKVRTAPTLEALAGAIDVNPTQLTATVAQWNRDVAGGKDTLFDKTVGLKPIEAVPFYAVQVTELNLGSHGGVKINARAQVIDVNGQAIRRLYAGGMNAGGFLGPYYPGSGTALNSTVTFGRIAGRNAAAEQPWA